MIIRTTFKEIKVTGTRRWKDESGKRRQETKTFSQTVNPFNKNSKGEVKSPEEIWKEINEKLKQWMSKD